MLILLAVVVSLGGCKKKKPPVPPPTQQVPTITEQQPQATVQEPPQQAPQPEQTVPKTEEQKPAATAVKPKPAPKRAVARKPAPPKQPAKVIVKDGSAASGQTGALSASISTDAAKQQQRATAELLVNTEKNLQNVNRLLNAQEEGIVQQIRNFMAQARAADKDGDFERSYNLANKAHLLSQELLKK